MGEKDATGRMEQQILQIAQGNKDAFASFYEETRTALFAFLLSYLDRQEAEDALQDAYLGGLPVGREIPSPGDAHGLADGGSQKYRAAADEGRTT